MMRLRGTRGGSVVVMLGVVAAGCAYHSQRSPGGEGPAPHAASRVPKTLCLREMETLKSDGASSFPAPPSPPKDARAKDARPPPHRRVVLENRLPSSYTILGLALPSATSAALIEAPHAGVIGETDGRGARGEVEVLVEAKRSGGLYEYVGDCEIVREYMELPEWDPRVPLPRKIEDLIVVVELANGRPMVHVAGVPQAVGRLSLGLPIDD